MQISKHADLCVEEGSNYSFASSLDSCPLLISEFSFASKYYGIVFIKTAENILPVVLLGYDQNKNLYIDEHGAWLASYVPAFLRRYPFILSKTPDKNIFSLCIDIECPRCNRQGKGKKLFTKDGKNTKYLNDTLQFVKEFQSHYFLTEKFTRKLNSLGLLTAMNAEIKLSNGKVKNLSGFMLVNIEALKNLPEKKLKELLVSDEFGLIYAHLNSLVNIKDLFSFNNQAESDQKIATSKRKGVREKTGKTKSSQKANKKASKKTTRKSTGKKITTDSKKKVSKRQTTKKSGKKGAKKKKN